MENRGSIVCGKLILLLLLTSLITTAAEGADFEPTDGVVDLFDFSSFAEQWLICNDPEDQNCINNW